MFDSHQKATGTQYTRTIALALTAVFAGPVLLFLSRPFGYSAVLLAVAFSLLCGGLAWAQWRRNSALTIPSLARQQPRSK